MFDIASFRRDFLQGRILQVKTEMWSERQKIFLQKRTELRKENPKDYIDKICKLSNEISRGYNRFVEKYYLFGKDISSIRTIYYSTIAHMKGRLHFKRINGNKLCSLVGSPMNWWGNNWKEHLSEGCVSEIYEWTLEDQERLVRRYVDLYTIIR